MRRHELEHLIRAAGAISGSREIVIVGSQAILGSFPSSPDQLLVSQEADLFPLDNPEMADLIDGSIGELSLFHEQFGYFAHGIGPETSRLPGNWRQRLIRVENDNTGGISGLCLSPVDIAISKLIAGRPKDIEYVSTMLIHCLIRKEDILSLLTELEKEEASMVQYRLERIINSPSP